MPLLIFQFYCCVEGKTKARLDMLGDYKNWDVSICSTSWWELKLVNWIHFVQRKLSILIFKLVFVYMIPVIVKVTF